MIFNIKDGQMAPVKEVDFSLERSLQRMVEANLGVLFNLKFLATEFIMKAFRFDSVAFDSESNSFVIIEYKRGKSESLVDQGYAYLNTALDRKSDLVLLYNEVTGENKQVKDFEWEGMRVFFVSPRFTDYQKKATGYQKMPFRLFEVTKYENDIVVLNEINNEKISDSPVITTDNSSENKAAKEIKVYSEEDHLKGLPDEISELYSSFKEMVMNVGSLDIKPTKVYVAFKVGNANVTDVEFFKSYLKVFINLPKGALKDPLGKAKDITDVGHHGNGDYCFDLKHEEDLDYLMSLIKQSYKANS